MDPERTKFFSFSSLASSLPDSFAESVVEKALQLYFREEETEAKAALQTAIRKHIRIAGFRPGQSHRAPPPLLRGAIMEAWRPVEDIARAVFNLWLEGNPLLVQQARAFLQQEGIEESPSPKITSLTEFENLVRRGREAIPAAGSDDEVRLVVRLLSAATPVSDEVYEQIRSSVSEREMKEKSDLWSKILEEIAALPPEAPEWETWEQFLEAIQEIGARKLQERQVISLRQELQQEIAVLCTDLNEQLAYFQMDGCAAWSAGSCPVEQVTDSLEQLRDLRENLERYIELMEQRPATVAERRAWQNRLDELEGRILSLYQELDRRLRTREWEEVTEEVAAVEWEEQPVEEIPEEEGEKPAPLDVTSLEEMGLPEVEAEEALPAVVTLEVETLPETVREEELETEHPLLTVVPEAEVFPEEALPSVSVVEEEIPEAIPEERPPLEEARVPEAVAPERVTEVPLPDVEEEANRVILSSLEAEDVLTAYWLSWAMERQGMRPVFRSPLLKALQGAFWAMRLWPELPLRITPDLREVVLQVSPGPDKVEQWLGAAAALYLALVAPADGWGEWLSFRSDVSPEFSEVAEAVRSFAIGGWPLQQADIRGFQGREERENAIRRLADEARAWLALAPNRRTTYQRASAVWRKMVSPGGELYEWFKIVAEDRRDQTEGVRSTLDDEWKRENWVDDRIQGIDVELVGRKLSPIEGTARRQLIRWTQEACEIAENWLQAVQQARQFAGREEWFQERAGKLLRSLEYGFQIVSPQINQLQERLEDSTEQVALRLLQRSLAALQRVLRSEGEMLGGGKYDPPLEALREKAFSENLTYRLLWLPEVPLALDDGKPAVREESARELLYALLDPAVRERSVGDALQGWVGRRDYRFVDLLPWTPEWESRCREAFRSDIADIQQDEVEETRKAIEQALIDGLISEKERGDRIGVLEGVQKDLRRVSPDLGDPETRHQRDLGALSRRLKRVRDELEEKRRSRLEDQRKRWENIRQKLGSVVRRDLLPQIQEAVQKSLDRGELRAVEEYLMHIEGALREGKTLSETLFGREPRDYLREFIGKMEPIRRRLEDSERPFLPLMRIIRLIEKEGILPPELEAPRLPSPRLREIGQAVRAWLDLKARRQELANEQQFEHVITLMKYLGFQVRDRSPISLVSEQPGIRHWRVQAWPGSMERVPVPQFGSERGGQYDVVGVWDRPGFNLLNAQLQRIVDGPAIVFYFGRLLARQREDLVRDARAQGWQVLIVDEILLLYLAREYDVRLDTFFYCSLPFTGLNPYVPFAAGVVPPEMFVGRQKEIQQLLDPRGPAIVYGGRQLGKSALLRQVWRQFHNPRQGRFAVLEDIKSLGDPHASRASEYESQFWSRMVNALTQVGFVDLPPHTSPDKVQQRIFREIQDHDYRLMVLLDEADNFLEADAGRNFPVVGALKTLMDKTDRRFKVVFAGLHNVQRFQRIPNQPLAHLGTPIEVGPLEPDAALELLRRPLEALGYRLGEGEEDPAILLHILSYTNYHPGLVQLFGRELVEHLRGSRYQGLPPFPITRSDVEAIYRKPSVREAIRLRFNWTLALDERYEAIALAMILDQWDARNGFDRLYTARELYQSAAEWWENGFRDVDMDQFRGYLDEMCGLGVLTYVDIEGGRYRLRSPNIVQLMGTYDELWARMDEITRKGPPQPLKIESHHALLSSPPPVYSPLSYAQESALRESRVGVGLVFGSEALGIRSLKEMTHHFVESREAWEEIRLPARRGEALARWLAENTKKRNRFAHLVFYRDLENAQQPEELEEQVRAAGKFCVQNRRPQVRVVFAFGPWATWLWFQLPPEQREELEERFAGAVVSLKKWDRIGIQQRLAQHDPELVATEQNCREIERVTGGWSYLLDEFLARCETDDPRPVLNQFSRELEDPDNAVRRKFLSLLIAPEELPARLIGAIRAEQSRQPEGAEYWIPRDTVPLLLEGEDPQRVSAAVDYLIRMSVLRQRISGKGGEQEIALDPVVYRLWDR